MHIISKWKDYYDHLSGIYGVDEKIILDRRKWKHPIPPGIGEDKKIELRICGMGIEGWWSGETKQYYYGSEIGNAPNATYHQKSKYSWFGKSYTPYPHYSFPGKFIRDRSLIVNPLVFIDEEKTNEKENCPILVREGSAWLHFPILQQLGLNKYLPPKDICLMLTEWLAPKDIVIDKQTDKEKIKSKGFDVKNSFRNTKHRLK